MWVVLESSCLILLTFEKFVNLNFAYNNFDILKNQMKIFPNHSIQIVLLNIQKKKKIIT